jgi:transcription antitermination factor NusG
MESVENDVRWYALHVRTRFEKVVARNLEARGYEEFLPTYLRKHQWSDRVKQIELPLFPGYIFCRFNINDRLPILTIPGVNSIVGIGRSPIPVEEQQLSDIKSVLASGFRIEPWPFLTVGQAVRVERGALVGVSGTIIKVRNSDRLVVSVHLLQRAVAVEIDRGSVSPLNAPSHSLELSKVAP